MKHHLDKKTILRIHPLRKYFEFLSLEYLSGIKIHLSNPIRGRLSKPKISKSKGVKQYIEDTVRTFLIGDIRILAEDFLKRGIWSKKISLKYSSIPPGVLRIMLNQRKKKLVELMALTGEYSVTAIAEHVNRLYSSSQPLSPVAISKYLYFFWGVLPSDDQGFFYRRDLISYLASDERLSKIYADHIEVALGNISPLEVSIKLGLHEEVTKQLNDQVYQGFALAVVRKNDAVFLGRMEDADVYSKIMIRDSQVLRNLGHKPKKRALRDRVKVIYDDED